MTFARNVIQKPVPMNSFAVKKAQEAAQALARLFPQAQPARSA